MSHGFIRFWLTLLLFAAFDDHPDCGAGRLERHCELCAAVFAAADAECVFAQVIAYDRTTYKNQ